MYYFTKQFNQKTSTNIEIKTINNSKNTFRNLITNKNNSINIKSMAAVYDIPRLDCKKKYVSETFRDELEICQKVTWIIDYSNVIEKLIR